MDAFLCPLTCFMSSNVPGNSGPNSNYFFYTNIVWFVYEQSENLAFSPDQTQQLLGLADSGLQRSPEWSQVYWRAAPVRGKKNLLYLCNRVSRTSVVYNIRGKSRGGFYVDFLMLCCSTQNRKLHRTAPLEKKMLSVHR